MARFISEYIEDEAVEEEIARLRNSEAVKLARAEERERNKRRQILYQLRSLEKRGLKLMEEGWKPESEDDCGDNAYDT